MNTTHTSSWQTKRFKYIASWQKGKQPVGLSGITESGDLLPYLTMEYLRGEESGSTLYATPDSNSLIAHDNDVILLWDGANAGEFLEAKRGHVSSTSALLIPRLMKQRFFFYACKSAQRNLQQTTVGMGVPHVNGNSLGQMLFIIPSSAEQDCIAAYLDEQTAKIDRLMEMRRRQMELLKEQRAALIQQAVTRGLNPDAPMKDSGIPWLGEIPAHWSVTTLGRLATLLQTGPFGSQLHSHEYVEDGIPIINPSHMAEGMIQHDPKCTVDEETARRLSRHFLELGDIVFARRGEIGRCALVHADEVGWLCGTGSLLMRPDTRVLEPAFLVTLFQLKHLKESLTLQSVGSTMDNLNTGILAGTRLPLPPREEQSEILQFIKNKSAKTEDVISACARQLTLLVEYRAALIHECVTGQREV